MRIRWLTGFGGARGSAVAAQRLMAQAATPPRDRRAQEPGVEPARDPLEDLRPTDRDSQSQAPVDQQLSAAGARETPHIHSRQRARGDGLAQREGRAEGQSERRGGRARRADPARAARHPDHRGIVGPAVCAASRRVRGPAQVQLDPQALEAIDADSDAPAPRPPARSGSTAAASRWRSSPTGSTSTTPTSSAPTALTSSSTTRTSAVGTACRQAAGRRSSTPAPSRPREADLQRQNYSALPLNQPCYIRVEGVAPGASLVGLDIFGAEDTGFNSSFLQAIDYAVRSTTSTCSTSRSATTTTPTTRPAWTWSRRPTTRRSPPDDGDGLDRRRGRHQHDRHAGHRPDVMRRRQHDIPARRPDRLRRCPVPRRHRLAEQQHQLVQLGRLRAGRPHGRRGRSG